MSLLLKVLLIAALIYFILKWAARLALKHFMKNMERRREDFFRHHQQMYNQQQGQGSEGDVTINDRYAGRKQKKSVSDKEGEYVEYEEVEDK